MQGRIQKQKGTCRYDVRNGRPYHVVLSPWVGPNMLHDVKFKQTSRRCQRDRHTHGSRSVGAAVECTLCRSPCRATGAGCIIALSRMEGFGSGLCLSRFPGK